MAIPALTESGWLPPGRHVANTAEVVAAFVDAFPESRTRRPIFESWSRYRQTLQTLTPVTGLWLNGSFISAKLDPGDIDVVVLLDGPAFDALPRQTRHAAASLMRSESAKLIYAVHPFALVQYPPPHRLSGRSADLYAYWDRSWGHTSDGIPKGYVELRDER